MAAPVTHLRDRIAAAPKGSGVWLSRAGVILFIVGLGLTLPKGASHSSLYEAAHGFLYAAGWSVTIGWLLQRRDGKFGPLALPASLRNVSLHQALSDVFYPALLGLGLLILGFTALYIIFALVAAIVTGSQ